MRLRLGSSMPYSCMNTAASSGESWAISISSLPCNATLWWLTDTSGADCPSPRLKAVRIGLRVSRPKRSQFLLLLGVEFHAAQGLAVGKRFVQAFEQFRSGGH